MSVIRENEQILAGIRWSLGNNLEAVYRQTGKRIDHIDFEGKLDKAIQTFLPLIGAGYVPVLVIRNNEGRIDRFDDFGLLGESRQDMIGDLLDSEDGKNRFDLALIRLGEKPDIQRVYFKNTEQS